MIHFLQGFDTSNCGDNVVSINGVRCGNVACTRNNLSVLFPGTAAAASLNIVVDVILSGSQNDTASLLGAITVSDAAPYIVNPSSSLSVSTYALHLRAMFCSASCAFCTIKARSTVTKNVAPLNETTVKWSWWLVDTHNVNSSCGWSSHCTVAPAFSGYCVQQQHNNQCRSFPVQVCHAAEYKCIAPSS